eukprot:gene7326-5162_t
MAISKLDPRMAFDCEQYDKFSGLTYAYVLYYFYEDGTLEMVQRKNGKLYVKRHKTDIQRSEFYLGSTIHVLGKMTKITGYADPVTQQLCEDQNERTTIIVSDHGMPKLGNCISIVMEELGVTITNIQLAWVKQETVEKYSLPDVLQSTSVVIMQCVSSKCLEKGIEVMRRCQGVVAASDRFEVDAWADFCIDSAKKPLAVFGQENSTVVVVKPHVILEKVVGSIVQMLCDAELEITGFTQLNISTTEMHHFMKPYQAVLPDIEGTVMNMVGTVWAIQFMSPKGQDVLQVVRQICGPYDSPIAKKLYPKSIRGRYGQTQTRNAVHCCDLPGDGPIYADFFFKHAGEEA